MNKHYKIITLGCKVNSYESEGMASILEKHNFSICNEINSNPDVVIINTCTVTGVSDHKSRQMIRRAITQYKGAKICVVGCYAQMSPSIVKEINGIDIIIGTKNRDKIGEYLEENLKSGKKIIDVQETLNNHEFDHLEVTSYYENTRAYLKIQDGCNNFCSFCIIPYARGPVRSRPKDDVLEEAKKLVCNNFKEIVLTGIHTAGYGQDLFDYKFADLLEDLLKIKSLKRLRISSIEESEIGEDFIEIMKKSEGVIVNHLHIPLQSGSDTILKKMNRKYNTFQYKETIERIRRIYPDISITTDVIVGFPGESDELFEETYKFIEELGYAQLHVFPYSIRNNTPAAKMENQVEPKIKKERVQKLIALSNKLANIYAKKFEGKILDVLFETYDEKTNKIKGHTTNYLIVEAIGTKEMINVIKNVKIIKSGFPINQGTIIEEE